MFDFSIVTRWFDELLRHTLGLGDFGAILIECVVVGLAIIIGYAVLAIVLILWNVRFVLISSAVSVLSV